MRVPTPRTRSKERIQLLWESFSVAEVEVMQGPNVNAATSVSEDAVSSTNLKEQRRGASKDQTDQLVQINFHSNNGRSLC